MRFFFKERAPLCGEINSKERSTSRTPLCGEINSKERSTSRAPLCGEPQVVSCKIIWVLKDDRAGNYSQATGLAEELALEARDLEVDAKIQIKEISYNFLARLPNFLKINGLAGISSISKKLLLEKIDGQQENPDIVISAGRKTAPIAAYLKRKYGSKAIQIMNPNLNFKKFDFVILPSHDKKFTAKNIIRIIGSLTRISDDRLEKEYQKFADILEKITAQNSAPKIALLVGGSSKKGKFTNEIAAKLGKQVSEIVSKMNANLLVLNSRRTGEEITETLDQNLIFPSKDGVKSIKKFFKWKIKDWNNPYFAVLKDADFIIATGDSISMCSEICCLGKPVYIFSTSEICSAKHLQFLNDLVAGGFARHLKNEILENYLPKKLGETKRVAKLLNLFK
ncbi:MAG: mitochondrial fission protein ELM1 [Rickettsiales bacterium]|jgi:mitochondrial fission protein ELM1